MCVGTVPCLVCHAPTTNADLICSPDCWLTYNNDIMDADTMAQIMNDWDNDTPIDIEDALDDHSGWDDPTDPIHDDFDDYYEPEDQFLDGMWEE